MFGVQYQGDTPHQNTRILIDAFDNFIQSSPAKKVETLHENSVADGKSRI